MEDLNNPPFFVEFCALHFPTQKVVNLAKEVGKDQESKIKEILKYRNSTSLKGFKQLSQVNEILFDTVTLLKAACYEKLNSKAKIIVDSFLNKSDFFEEASKYQTPKEDDSE